jgi:NTE family protein
LKGSLLRAISAALVPLFFSGVTVIQPSAWAQEATPVEMQAEANPPATQSSSETQPNELRTAPPAQAPAAKMKLGPTPRPRVVLVLSGGGARGAAHIGVLKVMDELRIPVDMVVGTSIGSIIGGLYAAGWSAADIEQLLTTTNLKQLFIDTVPRREKTYRRKQDDARFLIPGRLHFKKWVPYLPPSLLAGQRLDVFLSSLEFKSTGEQDFNRLPIPFRAVAVDLATGDAVVIDHGHLATAMRASMAIAGVFAPVSFEGKKLVDGGAAANLPIGIARDLGAQSIIAVDITSPLNPEEQLGSFFSILGQMSGFLTVGNRIEDLKRLQPGDILIQPDLGDIGFSDFGRAADGITAGEKAARAKIEELKRFSVSEEEYARFKAGHHLRDPAETKVDKVDIVNTSWVDDDIVSHRLPDLTGRELTYPELEHAVTRLSGLDYFGLIQPEFHHDESGGTLTMNTPLKPYGKNSLQFGLSLEDNFDGQGTYAVAIRHLLVAANRRAGEWENIGQLGTDTQVSSTYYQPLDGSMHWFASPRAFIGRSNPTLWVDNQAVAELYTSTWLLNLDAGRTFGDWGEARLGAYTGTSDGHVKIGTPVFPDFSDHDAGVQLSFRVDTLDSTVFPVKGVQTEIVIKQSEQSMGADQDRQQDLITSQISMKSGRNIFVPGFEIGWTPVGVNSPSSLFKLGGIGRLSGLHPDELLGDKYGLARVIYYRELKRLDLGALSSSVYAGASIETGNMYAESDPVSLSTFRFSGGIFLGAKTVIGPVYVAYGMADGGEHVITLAVGQRF